MAKSYYPHLWTKKADAGGWGRRVRLRVRDGQVTCPGSYGQLVTQLGLSLVLSHSKVCAFLTFSPTPQSGMTRISEIKNPI